MTALEKIRELAGRLGQLSADELEELRGLIVSEFDHVEGEGESAENVAIMNELAETGEKVQAEGQNRVAAEEANKQAAADARARLNAVMGRGDDDGEQGTGGDAGAGAGAGTGESEGGLDGAEPTPEAVAAAAALIARAAGGGRVARRAGRALGAPRRGSPELGAPRDPGRPVMTASGAVRGDVAPGAEITDRYQLAEAMAGVLNRLDRQGPARGDIIVASTRWQYPEEQRLTDDQEHNARLMDTLLQQRGRRDAMVATGGVCLPVNVDYAVPTWAGADRPVRDGLAAFQANRGGLRYVQPPDIGALAGSTAVWTEATDANPAGATKPVVQIACGTEQLVYTDAVSTRIGFGNMQSRFAPEQVAANTDLATAYAARVAENNLLTKIHNASVQDITSATVLGAARDMVTTVDRLIAAYRYLHRIPSSVALTCILPEFIKQFIRMDLARELAHDSMGRDPLAVTDEEIIELFTVRGVTPIFHLDGLPSTSGAFATQGFPAFTAAAAAPSFPTNFAWYFFVNGTIQFLDGGLLELGVVRDATLDATNDYETFFETFEGIAFRGFASGCLEIVSTLCASGASGATATVSSCL